MKAKRIISFLLATVMLVCAVPMSASALSANDVATIIDATEDVVKTLDKLSAKELDVADLIKTTAEQIASEKAVDVIKEVLDNGTDVFVAGTDLKAVAESFGIKLTSSGGEDFLFGGYISADNGKYTLTELCAYLDPADAADPVVANKFKSVDFKKYIDDEQLIADNAKREAAAADAGDSGVAKLQAINETAAYDGPLVADGVKAFYWFREGDYFGFESNNNFCLQDANKGEIDGWSVIATLRMSYCSYLCGWDAYVYADRGYYVYTVCTFDVSPRDGTDKKVVGYKVSMDVDLGIGTAIGDYTKLSTNGDVVSVKYNKPMEMTVTNSYGEERLTIPYEYPVTEYYYKPNYSQDFSERATKNTQGVIQKVTWTATPKDPKADAGYYMKPGVMARAKIYGNDIDGDGLIVFLRFENVVLEGSLGAQYSIENHNYNGQAQPTYFAVVYWEDVDPYI